MDFAIDHDDGLQDTGGLPVFMLSTYLQAPQGIMIPDFSFYDWPTSRCPGENSRAFSDFIANASERLRIARIDSSGFVQAKSSDLFWRGAPLLNPKRSEQLGNLSNLSEIPVGFLNAELLEWQQDGCVTLHDHCKHRYLLHLQGNTYSSRLKYLMLCGSVVFMPQQEYEEWWYPAITSEDQINEDNEVVVHLKNDMSNFASKLALYKDTEGDRVTNRSVRISMRALEFATEVFSENSVDCYWASLLIGASKSWGRILEGTKGRPIDLVLENLTEEFSEL